MDIQNTFSDIRNCFLDIQNNYFGYPKTGINVNSACHSYCLFATICDIRNTCFFWISEITILDVKNKNLNIQNTAERILYSGYPK